MNILLVEDDPDVRKITVRLLEYLNCKVVAVSSAHEAISRIEEQGDSFDLVMTDYSMQEMDGLELAVHLKKIAPHTPVVLCTGIDNADNTDLLSGSGVTEILLKPYTKNQLDLTIKRATARQLTLF